MPRTPEAYGRSSNREQERSSLDELRRDVSVSREAFAKEKTRDAMARKAAKAPRVKESGGFSSSERTAYEEKLREYRNALLDASTSETDPKKKAALLREALIDTTVKEADELWSAERRMKAEAKGGSGAWEKLSMIANRTVEGYRKLSWKQKLAISGALLVGANTGIPLVMGGAAVGIAAQRVLSAGSAAMGMDALIKRFGIDRSRVNEILGTEIRKEKDPIVLAEKLSAMLKDENNSLNEQMLGMGGRKTKEVALRGAVGAAIFGSVLLGLPAKAIGQGVEHVAGDQIRAVRSMAGRAVHKMAGFFMGSAEGSIPPGGGMAMARGGVLATEEKIALDRVRQGVHNRMAFNEGYGQEEQIARMKAQTETGIKNRMDFNEGSGPEDQLAETRSKIQTEKGIKNRMAFDEGHGQEEQRVRLEDQTKKGLGNRRAFNEGYGQEEQMERSRLQTEKGIKNRMAFNEGHETENQVKKTPLNAERLSFQLQKGGSIEGTINQYLKSHVEEIKEHPELQKALGWDGDPQHIGRASHRLWLRMVDDVRVHPNTAGHQKLIERLEQAGFHVKEAIKDTHHPERLTRMFDAAARRMPIGMEFTVNSQTGAIEFSDPHVGKVTGGVHEAADSSGKKIARGPIRPHVSDLQDKVSVPRTTEVQPPNTENGNVVRAYKTPEEIAYQSAQALKRGDAQLQKIGLFAQERSAWLADKTTHVGDVLRQIPPDYDIGRGGAGIDINLPHQDEYRWGAVPRQIKLAQHLREAMERAHLRFDEVGIPKNAAVRDMTIGQFLSNVNPRTGAFESPR